MSLLFFLFQVIVVSLSGVMAPGPVTAAALAMGARSKYAGILIALGHAIIEVPLMVLILLGMGKLLKSTNTQIAIGLAGGVFLLLIAIRMLISLKTTNKPEDKPAKTRPILTGLILSVSNPYFLIWWATVGITIAIPARQLGIWAFALFAILHWLCDCAWLQVLSWASFKGSALLGPRSQRVIPLICSLVMFVFGLIFIYNATGTLVKLILF